MSLSDEQIQADIILRVGEVWQPAAAPTAPPVPLLASTIAVTWERHADKANVAGLQALYVERDCIDKALVTVRDQVNFAVANDYRSDQGDRFKHLQQMRANCQAEIARVEQRALAGRGAAIGTLTNTGAVVSPITGRAVLPLNDAYPLGGWR